MTTGERIDTIKKKLKARKLKLTAQISLLDENEIGTYSLEDICKRAIISAIMSKCAFYLYDAKSKKKIKDEYKELLNKYGVYDYLYDNERDVLNKNFNEPLCDTIGWRYQSSIALLWFLGLVENIDNATLTDDIEKEICTTFDQITSYESVEDLMSQSTPRSKEEISDALVLYRYYHWAVMNAYLSGKEVSTLFYDVVLERRRALEWILFSKGEDWNFTMDT